MFHIYSLTEKDNKVYVYFAAGSSLYGDNMGQLDYENGTDYFDYDCTKKADTFLMMITEVNYKQYDHYRLVFEKSDDNYFFKKLEKLQ